MSAKDVVKYILLFILAVFLGLVYCFIIHSGFDFTPISNGEVSIADFVVSTFSITTLITFVVLFFYMVFFIKFLIKLFK